jgi:hypothetical protein
VPETRRQQARAAFLGLAPRNVETGVDGHHGHQVSKVLLDNMGNPPGAGALFGLTAVAGQGIYFVDDNENALNLFH